MSSSSITVDTGRQQSLVSPMSTLDTATAVEVQRPEDTAQPVDTPSTYPNPEGTGQDPTGARPPTTVSVDTMAEDLRDSLLRGMNEEIARLFSVDEYDGKFAQILKRFSLSFARKVNQRRMAILHGEMPEVTREDQDEWKQNTARLILKRWELVVYYVLYQIKAGEQARAELEVPECTKNVLDTSGQLQVETSN